jgi:microcystin-dependent protein
MPNFTFNTITVIAEQEIAALVGGSQQLTITRVAVGSGVSGSPTLQTDLVNFQMNLTPVPPQVSANTVQQGEILVFCTLDTANVGSSFTWTELGVYAQISGQAEFLLAYCVNSGADSITHETGLSRSVYNLQIPINIGIANSTSVTVVAGNPFYIPPVRSPDGSITVTTPFDVAGRVQEWDIEVAAGIIPIGVVWDYAGGSLPGGFLLCNSVQYSRIAFAGLFACIGTLYGAGDGVTTFNVPDCRGRTTIGAGMGPGLGAYVLGATLGEEYHTLLAAEMPSHAHGISQSPHTHAVSDPSHVHGITDRGHNHGLNDPSHGHSNPWETNDLSEPAGWVNLGGSDYSVVLGGAGASPIVRWKTPSNDYPNVTGISLDAAGTGIAIRAAVTGISVVGADASLAIQASGGGARHNNIQPSIVFNKIIKY